MTYNNGSAYTFAWSNGRQLTSGTKGSTSFAYTYNADGLRTQKVVNGVTTTYYWAGSQLAMMVITNGTSVKTLKFYYDAEGRPMCLDYNGAMYFYITNLQGDVVALSDQYGEVIRYEYDAWGKPIVSEYYFSSHSEVMQNNPLRYRGYIYDAETGFYYLQSRYYDPIIGRFINSDGQLNGGFLGNNMFAYCGNNPVNRVDQTGEAWKYILLMLTPIPGPWVLGLIAEIKVSSDMKNGEGYDTMEDAVVAWAEVYSKKTSEDEVEYGAIILSKEINGKTYYYMGKTRKGFSHTCWNSFVLGYMFHTGKMEGFIHTHPTMGGLKPSYMDKLLFRLYGIQTQFIVNKKGDVVKLDGNGVPIPLEKEDT